MKVWSFFSGAYYPQDTLLRGNTYFCCLVAQLCLTIFAAPWTIACQAPLCMGFPRQEYWSGLPFPSPGDLPDPGIESRSPTLLEDSLLSESLGKPGVLVPEFMKFPLKKVQIMSFYPLINKLSLGRGSEFLESNQAKGSGLYVTFYIIFFFAR